MSQPCLIVLHYTAMDSAEDARDWLCTPEAQVSAHYLVGRDGRVWHLVPEEARAWHAGAGAWGGISDVNSASIGIEIDNPGDAPFAEPAMAALEALLPGIMARWDIGPEGVIGHSDCAPGRKIDPGLRFDWRRLARRGLAHWPEAGADPGGPIAPLLARAGYTGGTDDVARLAAFRLRFRPRITGAANAADRALLAALPPAPGAAGLDGPTPGA